VRLGRSLSAACVLGTLSIMPYASAQTLAFKDPLVREKPNQLATAVYVSDNCLIAAAEVEDIVNGVLVGSRIRPINFFEAPGFFYLEISVDCLKATDAFSAAINFRDVIDHTAVRLGEDFGGFGTHENDKQFLLDRIKTGVDAAVGAYLKANPDL